ncbi:unnamed protein product [Arctogadus glacialis]
MVGYRGDTRPPHRADDHRLTSMPDATPSRSVQAGLASRRGPSARRRLPAEGAEELRKHRDGKRVECFGLSCTFTTAAGWCSCL